jgi:hypothetical protein
VTSVAPNAAAIGAKANIKPMPFRNPFLTLRMLRPLSQKFGFAVSLFL